MTPIISVQPDGDYFRLMVTSYTSRAEPAGQRLFRAPPFPDIAWLHEDEATAIEHAERLRTYLAGAHSGKARKSKRGEEEATVEVKAVDISGAIWNL